MNAMGTQSKLNARRSLIFASVLYLFNAALGTMIAVRENLPSILITNFSTGKPALEDFLTGNGTALSPPLYLYLVTILFLVLACLPKRLGIVGAVGLTISGMIFLLGEFAEKLTYRVFNPVSFDLSLALVELAAMVLPLLMIVFGMLEIAHKRSGSS
jgi:hypothetical protein